MNSTTKTVSAELQYASRTTFSSAIRKLSANDRRRIADAVNHLYGEIKPINPQINKTDILRLLAAIGAFSALLDPKYAGSS